MEESDGDNPEPLVLVRKDIPMMAVDRLVQRKHVVYPGE